MAIQKKKRKITKNKVIGSIQVTIGILILLMSIGGFLINYSNYKQNTAADEYYLNLLEKSVQSMQNSSKYNEDTLFFLGNLKPSENNKDILLLNMNMEQNALSDSWWQEINLFLTRSMILIVAVFLSLLFITQGIVNFGLNKEQNGK